MVEHHEQYFKDPLLNEWWDNCSPAEIKLLQEWANDARVDYSAPLALCDLCIAVTLNNSQKIADAAARLRNAIIEKLVQERELRTVLTNVQWSATGEGNDAECPTCGALACPQYKHLPDCRLGKALTL